jgi:virulence-associated protein VagC
MQGGELSSDVVAYRDPDASFPYGAVITLRHHNAESAMNATPKRLPTRVFRAGNSQAVRIPKSFELPEGEAVIEQRPGGLFIKHKHGGWAEFFAKPPLSATLDPAELRATGADRPVDLNLPKSKARKRKQK